MRGVRSGMADSLARGSGRSAAPDRMRARTGSDPGAEGRRGRVRGQEASATCVPALAVDAVLRETVLHGAVLRGTELRSLRREIAVLAPQLLLLAEEGIVLELTLSRLLGLEAVLATVAAVQGAELVLVASTVLRNRRICPGRTELRTVLGLRGLSIGAEPVLIDAEPILLRAAPVRGAAGPVLRDGRLHARAVLGARRLIAHAVVADAALVALRPGPAEAAGLVRGADRVVAVRLGTGGVVAIDVVAIGFAAVDGGPVDVAAVHRRLIDLLRVGLLLSRGAVTGQVMPAVRIVPGHVLLIDVVTVDRLVADRALLGPVGLALIAGPDRMVGRAGLAGPDGTVGLTDPGGPAVANGTVPIQALVGAVIAGRVGRGAILRSPVLSGTSLADVALGVPVVARLLLCASGATAVRALVRRRVVGHCGAIL